MTGLSYMESKITFMLQIECQLEIKIIMKDIESSENDEGRCLLRTLNRLMILMYYKVSLVKNKVKAVHFFSLILLKEKFTQIDERKKSDTFSLNINYYISLYQIF